MAFINTIISKFKVKEIAAISFFSSLLLTVLPNGILKNLALLEFKNNYKTTISLVLIVTTSYYLLNFIKTLKVIVFSKMFPSHKKAIRYMKNHMSEDEMSLIIETFYDKSNNLFLSTGKISMFDGRRTPLESKKVIYLSSTVGDFDEFAYSLQPYARKFLNKNLKKGNINIAKNNFSYVLK